MSGAEVVSAADDPWTGESVVVVRAEAPDRESAGMEARMEARRQGWLVRRTLLDVPDGPGLWRVELLARRWAS